ncbi:Hypothetical protein SMAX5B_022374 [Scophthalmus maximus]|uniref:Uncharacterized protein n=1 Tax=Scophthalmus maximus TaxID=52904 RepID=A0A2U9C4L5_SCOMX|nr:Hypothetical protein SMAX5B_022374 [Scophthalmus maximus]
MKWESHVPWPDAPGRGEREGFRFDDTVTEDLGSGDVTLTSERGSGVKPLNAVK